jgi:hypothetical protein
MGGAGVGSASRPNRPSIHDAFSGSCRHHPSVMSCQATVLRRLTVTAFAAWMLFCCCEKRVFAALVSCTATSAAPDLTGESSTASCCSPQRCCSESFGRPGGDQSDDSAPGEPWRSSEYCADGCCNKTLSLHTAFQLDLDAIGTLLPPTVASEITLAASEIPLCASFDRSDGGPPSRLILVISARLRI